MRYLLLALAVMCGNAHAARCAPFEDSADYFAMVGEYSLSDAEGPYLLWTCYAMDIAAPVRISVHCLEGSWATLTIAKLGDRAETVRKSATPIAAFHASVKRHVTDPKSLRCAALIKRAYNLGG